jgi:hypothetical protein
MIKPLITSVVMLSCAVPARAADPSGSRRVVEPFVLTAAVAGDCRASADAIDLMKGEAARIWARGGVTVRWVAPADVPFDAAPGSWLLVRCAGGDGRKAVPDAKVVIPIAAIRFVGSLPTNTIAVDIDNAHTLMARESRHSRDPRGRFAAFLDVGLGRMLGRAVAHEIGHFLSQSGAHTTTGLMRATHTVAALTGASLGPFKVDNARVVWASTGGAARPTL